MVLGKPLIQYTIETALEVIPASQVIVITDDDEIAEVCLNLGAVIIREPSNATGLATLDQLMLRHIPDLKEMGATDEDLLLTMQPTCPLVKSERIIEAQNRFAAGAGSVITVKDDRHLTWTIKDGQPKPLYEARVNRQQLPAQFRESGAIIGARIGDVLKHQTRIVEPIALVELPESESLDIDTFADLVVAEHWLSRKSIVLYANAAKELGMGHVYRTLALAQELARHEVVIATLSSMPLGKKFFDGQVFNHLEIDSELQLAELCKKQNADLVVLDILDTTKELIADLKATGSKVVTFEDLGPGAQLADLLVSDLYENPLVKNQLTGVENAILAPSFETVNRQARITQDVEHVLVLFGGTDPSELARKSLSALQAIGYQGKVSCVRGLGASAIDAQDFDLNLEVLSNVQNIGALMAQASLALSSAGRTITELMSIGVPTICLAQNEKELTHTHASYDNGVLNLGLGSQLSDSELQAALTKLFSDYSARVQMQQRALLACYNRSNSKVVARILDLVLTKN